MLLINFYIYFSNILITVVDLVECNIKFSIIFSKPLRFYFFLFIHYLCFVASDFLSLLHALIVACFHNVTFLLLHRIQV